MYECMLDADAAVGVTMQSCNHGNHVQAITGLNKLHAPVLLLPAEFDTHTGTPIDLIQKYAC